MYYELTGNSPKCPEKLEIDESFCYLRDIISWERDGSETIEARVKMFSELAH